MKTANYNLHLDKGWKFHLGQVKRFRKLQHEDTYNASKAGGGVGNMEVFLNENCWQNVEVPHDWLTALPLDPSEAPANGYKPRGVGWYYNSFELPDVPVENARLVFDGVLGQCTVYVNGIQAARNFSGYNRFSCEIASYLLPGKENMIVLYVDGTIWEGWWYEGAGLYRPVYIEFRETEHFDAADCFIRSVECEGGWEIAADLNVLGLDAADENERKVSIRVEDPKGVKIAEKEIPAAECQTVRIPVENPVLWTPETPELYTFLVELKKGEACLDTLCIPVGIRSITWCQDTGMYLNGKSYQVKGICCHQDHAGVGAAVSEELIEYRISLLKKLGVNAYRCAHHAPSESLLDICDRLGMLVMVENRHFGVSQDIISQLESMVRMSRNHPSVFIYSLFNEEPWQGERRGYLMARQMREHLLALDNTRAVTAAMNGGILEGSNASDSLDVIGVNYHIADYENAHLRTPGKTMIGTENCPTLATRGVYANDREMQVYNSYGDDWAGFSESIDVTMENVLTKPYNAGCFAWSGFDYYGEPAPYAWPSVMSHWGVMDNCGFAKDIAYHLAAWYKTELFVHLMPHWNWTEGEEVRVCVFTNADTAELFVNGRSAGEVQVNRRRAEWKVPFEKGTICVKARKGNTEISDEVHTAGKPSRLVLEDVTPKRNNNSVRIINISVTDAEGTLVPDCDKEVHFGMSEAKILGVGNGNPNGHQQNTASVIALFHGRAQVIVTAHGGTIKAQCEGLPDAEIV